MNMNDHGFTVSVYNRTASVTEEFLSTTARGSQSGKRRRACSRMTIIEMSHELSFSLHAQATASLKSDGESGLTGLIRSDVVSREGVYA
jgi:hypothetical protein